MQNIRYTKLADLNATFTVDEFIAAAREYRGVRFLSQGRDKHGMDCGGLVLALWVDLGYADLTVEGYSNRPDGGKYEWLLDSCMAEIPKEETRAGDVVACDFGDGIQHIAIVTSTDPKIEVIHASRNGASGQVVEQYLYGKYKKFWVKTYRLRHWVK
jgi:cell wall-associated NlpC family hydrolase